jgi:hypothetical protein
MEVFFLVHVLVIIHLRMAIIVDQVKISGSVVYVKVIVMMQLNVLVNYNVMQEVVIKL